MMKNKLTKAEEMMNEVVRVATKLTIATLYFKFYNDMRKTYPEMFWAMFKKQNENLIYNCRM